MGIYQSGRVGSVSGMTKRKIVVVLLMLIGNGVEIMFCCLITESY